MSDNECKGNVKSLLYNGTYLFTYNVNLTELDKFLDPEAFHITNFQVGTSVAIEVQLQAWNINSKGSIEYTPSYSFKLVGLYHI